MFPNLVDSVVAHLAEAEPARRWHCKTLPSNEGMAELRVHCLIDGGVVGFGFGLPLALAGHDHDPEWVEITTHGVLQRMQILVARMN